MFDTLRKSRFAPPMQFGPSSPSLTQVLAAVGLVALGIGIGARLAPLIMKWNSGRGINPPRKVPMHEIDRWANEGGAVSPPELKKATTT